MLLLAASIPIAAVAQNPGDPLFCQPNEGVAYLIVNGGAGVFTVDPDCYNNNIANDVTNTINTSQGGTLIRTPTTGNYIYTPPTANFTGLDTFSIAVTTVWNAAGGPGSAGGATRPGGPATLNVTLNVIPATVSLGVAVGGLPVLVPVPPGSITGCGAQGNAGQGPPPGAVAGCITSIARGFGGTAPSHGTLSTSGNTLLYTPNGSYAGVDTFTYQALGINTDGSNALNSGNVTVQVSLPLPGSPLPPTWTLVAIGIACLGIFQARHRLKPSA